MASVPSKSKHLVAPLMRKAFEKRMAKTFNCAFEFNERMVNMLQDEKVHPPEPKGFSFLPLFDLPGDDNEYEATNKKFSPACIVYREQNKATRIDNDYVSGQEPTVSQVDWFNKRMIELGYNLWDTIDIDKEFIDYAKKESCFIRWLLRLGYIKVKPKVVDKWDFDQGRWGRIGWKDVDKLRKGTMIAREWNGNVAVREITTSIYNKPFGMQSETLLAIRYKVKGSSADYKFETYLADLFRGKVYIRVGD